MLAPDVVQLQYGRTLWVESTAGADVVEVHAPDGQVELRFKVTEDGVVLQLEANRISLKAKQSLDLTAEGDVRIQGARVFIN